MSYIDAHVHVWTDDYDRYPFGAEHNPEGANPKIFLADDILGHARPCGVERVVLVQMSYYQTDNSYMLDVMDEHPGVFSGIGVVDVGDSKPDEEMLRLAQRGVRGFRISGESAPKSWLDGEGVARMFRAGAEHRLALCPLIRPEALPALDRRCREFPDTPVIIDHLGLVGVGEGSRWEEEVEALCAMATHREVMVKVSAFYALGKGKPPYDDLSGLIQRVCEAFGPERLMWASDCPFQVQGEHTYEASVALIRDRLDFLSVAEREQILGGTAEAFFFLR
ncbi:MAG: amidohydrolase [Gemmatimonadetes bacterium]|jgi:predicted TIM-barrel fold metal-dependent hydrolase|nr:amidohydrolase [Gemmatimonadota bacterium]